MLSDTCEPANAMSDGVQSHTSQRTRNDITPDVREENRRPRIEAQMEITDVDVAILAPTAGEWQEMLRQISNPTPNRDGCSWWASPAGSRSRKSIAVTLSSLTLFTVLTMGR
jgi:hypothetical protein